MRICWRHCSNNSLSPPLTPSGLSSLKSLDKTPRIPGNPSRRRTSTTKPSSTAMHHRSSCIPAGRGFATVSFFSEDHQNVCYSWTRSVQRIWMETIEPIWLTFLATFTDENQWKDIDLIWLINSLSAHIWRIYYKHFPLCMVSVIQRWVHKKFSWYIHAWYQTPREHNALAHSIQFIT